MYQDKILVRQLGLQPYEPISQAMHEFTDTRDDSTLDEIWLVEHYPVFTQGQAGKAEHILMPGDIPVIQSDRGGQVTYHGPGQQVMYVLLNLKRRARCLCWGKENLLTGFTYSTRLFIPRSGIKRQYGSFTIFTY